MKKKIVDRKMNKTLGVVISLGLVNNLSLSLSVSLSPSLSLSLCQTPLPPLFRLSFCQNNPIEIESVVCLSAMGSLRYTRKKKNSLGGFTVFSLFLVEKSNSVMTPQSCSVFCMKWSVK